MSDAMTSREIEDVLSSVRRLVSQESQRPASTRLILTQAQRVAPVPEVQTPEGAAPQTAVPEGLAPAVKDQPAPHKQLEDTIAELEAAVSASGETWESETGEVGPAPGLANVTAFARRPAPQADPIANLSAVATEPAPAASVAAPVAAEPPAAPMPTAETQPEPDEAVLDEETLRQIVAVLVREELQGQLGERVTFQVRKLVRAEIARILDERDLI